MIAIAHRLSTIRHMDRIVVMKDGSIIEEGTFDQLINNEGGISKNSGIARLMGWFYNGEANARELRSVIKGFFFYN